MSVRRKIDRRMPPFFPFYVDDYLGGTLAYRVAEHGAYLLALVLQWSSCEDQAVDPERLKTVIGGEIPACVLAKFEVLESGGLRNLRLASEFEKAFAARSAQRSAARSTNAKRYGDRDAHRGAKRAITRTTTRVVTDVSSLRSDTTASTSLQQGRGSPEGEGGKKRAARAKKGNGPVQLSWVAAACDDWKELVGGTPPGGRIGAAVGALCRQLGRDVLELTGLDEAQVFERIRGVWRFYLGSEKAEFVNPQGFAQKFGVWAQRASGVTDPRREKLDPVAASLERFRDAGDTGKGGLL